MRSCCLLLALTSCGRFGFSSPPGDTPSGDTVRDIGVSSCADVGGRACTATEICIVATVTAPDVADCCPSSRCLARNGKGLVTAPHALATVVIDGVLDEWTGVPTIPLAKPTIGNPTAADFTGQYALQWDSTSMYVLFQLTDDVCRPQDSVPPRAQAYNDDTAEVYLDMDPTTSTASFDGDEQWTWVPQNCGANATICGQAPPAAPLTTQLANWVRPPPNNNSIPGTTLTATYANDGATNCNWWVEVAVVWPSGFPTPIAGDVLGFDAAANDDDTGLRRNQLFWNDGTGTISMNASRFGLMQLLP